MKYGEGTRPVRGVQAMLAVMAVAAGQHAPASAQAVGAIDEIVVQATRLPKAELLVPAAIGVVGEDDVQLGRQQLGLDESLSAIPGLFMQDRYNFAQDLRIAIRGFGARSNFGIRGVKIVVDSIPQTLPDGQGQVDSIDLGSVQQIEVIKGPASSLYGNASGGVINIRSESGPEVPFVDTRLSTGEYGFEKYQVKAGGVAGRLNYLVNASDMQYDGYREHSETKNTQVNGRFAWKFNERQNLTVIVNATDQPLANDPGGIDRAQAQARPRSARQRNIDFDAGEALTQQKLGLVYNHAISGQQELRLRNYYVWRNFANRLPFSAGGAVEIDRFFAGGGASYAFAGQLLGMPSSLITGFDIDLQDDDRRRFDNDSGVTGQLAFDQNERVSSYGWFARNELAVSDAWLMTLGLRYDRVTFDVTDFFSADGNNSGKRTLSELSPMMGLVYTGLPSLNVYANISTGFETPTTTEFANPDGAGGFNPNLDPQFATNYEVGIKAALGQRSRLDLALFHIRVDGELVPFEAAGQPGRDFYSNAGESGRNGVELALVSQPLDALRLSLAYTWSDFKFEKFIDEQGNDFAGNALPGIPEHLFHAEMKYTHGSGFFGVFDVVSASELYVNNANTAASDAYAVSNLRAGFAARLGRWEFAPFAGISNLFGERYFANVRINAFGGRYFEPAPGRNAYGGVSIRYDF